MYCALYIQVMKRFSWTALFLDEKQDETFKKEHLFHLDDILYECWALGKNIILGWSVNHHGIDLLVVPHYVIGEAVAMKQAADSLGAMVDSDADIEGILQELLAGSKMVSLEDLQRIGNRLECDTHHIELPFIPGRDLPLHIISSLVKRYSISFVEDRAVALFDAVGFSHYSPLEQAVQLNSLSYSVNTAYSKLLDREIKIRFARTSTGDGFYIWNRGRSRHANVDLYHFMHLVLADNAVARSKSRGHTAPLLRACFHVGSHYEFYQAEGLNPTTFSYIVGDVTIELARMIDQARAGQILVGDFHMVMPDTPANQKTRLNAPDFIQLAQHRLSSLKDLVLGGDPIDSIKCYLTGASLSDGSYSIHKYLLKDKHGYSRYVFNAKVNIYRKRDVPIFLGKQDTELSDFGITGA